MDVRKLKQIRREFEHLLISWRMNLHTCPRAKPNGNEYANHRSWRWTRSKEGRLGPKWSLLWELKKAYSEAMLSVVTWHGKIKDGCLRCPLHQTTYHPEDGSINEWSPAHYFPAYGKLLGKLRKPSSLKMYNVREHEGYVEIDLNS